MRTDYSVEFVLPSDIRPSPENDAIYGEIKYDDAMEPLLESLRNRGLEEPLIVSADNYIISGHRRYFALLQLNADRPCKSIPIRRKPFARCDHLDTWHKILAEYNPQRVKSVGTLLKESLLRHADDNPRALLRKREQTLLRGSADFTEVCGTKSVNGISDKKSEFLAAVIQIVDDLEEFWPLTVRTIHYNLLNNPPLTLTPKRSKFDREHYRYRNNKASYDCLVGLLTPARYEGHIPMHCIDDPTRPKFIRNGFSSLTHFVEQDMSDFLCGYHFDHQLDQPRHIEVLGEKNTLTQIVNPVCNELYVPLSLGRGYSSIPVFREIAERFKTSGKDRMTLIVCSDYDPEGLDLADDAIRTLRDLWHLPVDYHRVGVTREQIEELNLAEDCQPAKESSSRFSSFVKRTGGSKCWELEALPPRYLRDRVREAIMANMDMEIYNATLKREESDAEELQRIRSDIVSSFNF